MSGPNTPTSSVVDSAKLAQMLAYVSTDIQNSVAFIIMEAILYGTFLTLSVISLRIQRNKYKATPSTPNLIVFIVALVLLANLTTLISLNITFTLKSIQFGLKSDGGGVAPLVESYVKAGNGLFPVRIAVMVIRYTTVCIADTVQVWRACAIWANNIKVVVLLMAILLTTFALMIRHFVSCYFVFSYRGSTAPDEIKAASQTALLAELIASACTNWLAMSLIAYRLWSFRRRVRQICDKKPSREYGILAYLVEMGFFLSIYQFCIIPCSLLLHKTHSAQYIAVSMFLYALPYVAGINPIMTTILVNKIYSVTETTVKEEPIAFAHHSSDSLESCTSTQV